ncbi:MAG: nucleotidyltransferase family protein [Alphaproteobacteria bacterium]|nr:nucleotidyltransferase family protein [Alphaproteobacteria bacterium]
MTKISTAMVFAAGLGTRMRPLTDTTPKPLLRVGGETMLDQALMRLAEYGVSRVIVNSHYLAEQIHLHITIMRPHYGFDIEISHEQELLETGGGLRQARDMLGDAPIFVLNADCIWRDHALGLGNLARLAATYAPEQMDGLLLVLRREQATGYDGKGDFFAEFQPSRDKNEVSLIRRRGAATEAPYVFSGIHILNPTLLDQVKIAETKFSVNKLWDYALARQRIYGLELTGKWFHVGTQGDLDFADRVLGNG